MRVHNLSELQSRSKLTLEQWNEIRIEAQAEILEGDLRSIRELTGKTQVELAPLLEMTQSELSKLENRNDYKLSTIRKFVEALGGELEIVAKIGDKSVRLHAV
jgi:predicted transcriptional regulator